MVEKCDEVVLYCIPSALYPEIDYEWHTPDSSTLPSSPIVYVSKPGIYFCTITFNEEQLISEPTDVQVYPGSFVITVGSVGCMCNDEF